MMITDARMFEYKDGPARVGDYVSLSGLGDRFFKAAQITELRHDDCGRWCAVVPGVCFYPVEELNLLRLLRAPRLFPEPYDLDELCECDLAVHQ